MFNEIVHDNQEAQYTGEDLWRAFVSGFSVSNSSTNAAGDEVLKVHDQLEDLKLGFLSYHKHNHHLSGGRKHPLDYTDAEVDARRIDDPNKYDHREAPPL